MPFERDLFISYTHRDNKPMSKEDEGWITRLQEALDARLGYSMGRQPRIWRDQKLAGNDIFGDEIVAQLPKSAVLLSVLSPRYMLSDWCQKEVDKFCKFAEQSIGLTVDNKSRVVKVLMSPVEAKDRHGPLPAVIADMTGYEFFEVDDSGTPREFDAAFGQEMKTKFYNKVATLAWEIHNVLKLLEQSETQPAATGPAKPTVYLAECSYDRRDAREQLKIELETHGYRILPDIQLSRDEDAYRTQVAGLLKQSQLSIHLVGATYGAVPDGPSQKSLVVLQNELATQQSRDAGLHRIIWLPQDTVSTQPDQQAFIHCLQTDPDAQFGADLIKSPGPEAIKQAIHATLKKLEKPASVVPPRAEAQARKLIYLICDKNDKKNTIALIKQLRSRGFDVEIPSFEGDSAEMRQANQEMLQQCSGVMIFYGEGAESWRSAVKSDLRKFRAVQPGASQLPVYTYLSGPNTDDKQYLVDSEEPCLLDGRTGLSEDTVQPFLHLFDEGAV